MRRILSDGGAAGREQHEYWWEEGQREGTVWGKDERPWEKPVLRREAGESCRRAKRRGPTGGRKPRGFELSGPVLWWRVSSGH